MRIVKNASIIFLLVLVLSCTKNKFNPSCWGDCLEAKFHYISSGCNGLKGYVVIESKLDMDTLNVVGSIPKNFRKETNGDGTAVCITYVEVEAAQFDSSCVHHPRTIKLNCISEN